MLRTIPKSLFSKEKVTLKIENNSISVMGPGKWHSSGASIPHVLQCLCEGNWKPIQCLLLSTELKVFSGLLCCLSVTRIWGASRLLHRTSLIRTNLRRLSYYQFSQKKKNGSQYEYKTSRNQSLQGHFPSSGPRVCLESKMPLPWTVG